MNKNAYLKELEKVTTLGGILAFVFLLVGGLVIHEQLQNRAPYQVMIEEDKNAKKTIRMDKGTDEGRTLFLENCASCHSIDMVTDLTGPALSGVSGRWKNQNNLYRWIQNNQALIAEGNPKAIAVSNFNSGTMPIFENLDTIQIRNILAYIENK